MTKQYITVLLRVLVWEWLHAYLLLTTALLLMFSINSHAHDHAKHVSDTSSDQPVLHISHARVNPIFAGMPVTAVYFDAHNPSDASVRLISVTSRISKRIEIHEHSMSNGLMKMQEIDGGVEFPAKKTTRFTPGGYHIMVMDLNQTIAEGDTIELDLLFSDNRQQSIKAVAKKPSHESNKQHH